MLSTRTTWDLRSNRLSRILDDKRKAGVPLLDLTESNPTRVGISWPEDVLAALADPAGRVYEPAPLGLPPARAAVALDLARRGARLGPERVVLTASTSEAYAFLFKLLCDPGDEVLVPRPGYPLFDFLAGLEGVRARPYALEHDGGWRLDVDSVRAALTPRTRAVVLVSPGNPTGAYLKVDERRALEALAGERGLALVADEVFFDFPFGDDARRTTLAQDGPALAFTLGGLSKSCGLPQLKLAWIAVTGPERERAEAMERLEVVADTYLSVSTPVQRALPALLARREERRRPLQARLEENLAALRERMGSASPATLLAPEGGWYGVLQVPATRSEEERVVRLLETRDVLVHPGYFFDFPREAYLVVSLLPEPAAFGEAIERVLDDLVL
jgi:alanine-synthesizing transaminase